MFCVIYSFDVKPNLVGQFEKSWSDLTELIYKYEGSLGSRLHKVDENQYIAYAQWPSRETWIGSGNQLPESAKAISAAMKAACVKMETLYELESEIDHLKAGPYSKSF